MANLKTKISWISCLRDAEKYETWKHCKFVGGWESQKRGKITKDKQYEQKNVSVQKYAKMCESATRPQSDDPACLGLCSCLFLFVNTICAREGVHLSLSLSVCMCLCPFWFLSKRFPTVHCRDAWTLLSRFFGGHIHSIVPDRESVWESAFIHTRG